jgi:malonyl CoA-acyl carrier protein transacylase
MAEAAKLAVVFPGQGSQRPGMARDFFDAHAAARAVFEEASEALELDLRPICFEQDPRLDLTEFTQPAILTAEIAMLRSLGLSAEYFAGHSLGEYTALCAAGVLSLADAVRLVRKRGALMQAAVPQGKGAMSALMARGIAERALASELADLGVDVANLNSADQVVISGPAAGIEAAEQRLTQAGGVEIVRLNVSAPFHSRMMAVIEPEFRAELEATAPRIAPENAASVCSNLRGGFHAPNTDAVIDALTGQISGTVDWIGNMRALSAVSGRIIELGPGRPLKRFFGTLGVEIVSITSLKTAERGLAR